MSIHIFVPTCLPLEGNEEVCELNKIRMIYTNTIHLDCFCLIPDNRLLVCGFGSDNFGTGHIGEQTARVSDERLETPGAAPASPFIFQRN